MHDARRTGAETSLVVVDSPVLATSRLRLRSRTLDDVEPIVTMDSDPEVRWYMGGPVDPESHRAVIRKNIVDGAIYHWAIEWLQQPGFLGMCHLVPLDGTEYLHVGWRLVRSNWGQGIATEAASAIVDYGLHTLRLKQVVAVIRPENRASIRVAERIGLHVIGSWFHYGFDHLLYSTPI